MNAAFLFIAIFALVCLFIAMLAVCWAASGSPDVNGDPECDGGGMSDDEIDQLGRSWDRGSTSTETRPNLEYSRRRNRNDMARSLFR